MSVNAKDVFSQIGIAQHSPSSQPQAASELGESVFLRLMTEQLKNQDPLKPLGSTEFLGQLAQFSTVNGVQQLGASMQIMTARMGESQALQATGMVGHLGYTQTDRATLESGSSISGNIPMTSAGVVNIQVADSQGNIVRNLSVNATAGSGVDFTWDGQDNANTPVAPGEYVFKVISGANTADMQLAARIDSISFTPTGMVLNLHGRGALTFDQLTRIS